MTVILLVSILSLTTKNSCLQRIWVLNIELGIRFASAKDFRLALRDYVIRKKFDIKFKKNDGDKVSAVCSEGCGWRIYASHVALQSTIAKELDIDVSTYKARRAKKRALSIFEGDEAEQYSKLRDYCALIQTTNPGSRATIGVDPTSYDNEIKTFQRIFICYAAVKKGFRYGCRPFLGVDGCFLKGAYGGHLLSVVAYDGNDQMFPVAIAVVETETKDSWSWFMTELMEAVGPHFDITFMSDRQKGLVNNFDTILYGAEHRFCVRHLYENFKLKYRGQNLKNEVWEAAQSYTEADFELHMNKIKEMNARAYEWLRRVPPNVWTRSSFGCHSKTALVINNMCESWNEVILPARDKSILYMLEWIRKHLMLRFKKKRDFINSKCGLLCPDIQEKINKRKRSARICKVHYAGDDKYEVECRGISEAVNIGKNTCTCRIWDVCGIPYNHAIACIFARRELPEIYVDSYYHRDTYLKTYENLIYPIPIRRLLSSEPIDPLLPLTYRKPIGRPKKARNKKSDDPSTSTTLIKSRPQLQCSRCNDYGHHTRTCKASEPILVEKLPPKRGGRPPLTTRGRGERAPGRSASVQSRGSSLAIGRGGGLVMQLRGGGSAMGRGSGSAMQLRGGGSVRQSRGGGSAMGRTGGSVMQSRGGGSIM
ncbi:uncharacterized protein LOC132269126 [Cornus florida]|uniref:uncharacterized protein LOC132269126 n=1 Tax=Cornus florida TaxID=4283 RepID=UPI00289A05AA|nr:uncharacterized protein LOC132269126 [Cornus florida]